MKLNKESIKQITLIMMGLILICVGYFNYSLDFEQDESIGDIAREKWKCT